MRAIYTDQFFAVADLNPIILCNLTLVTFPYNITLAVFEFYSAQIRGNFLDGHCLIKLYDFFDWIIFLFVSLLEDW